MTYRGYVKNGMVVLDDNARLAEGTPVHVSTRIKPALKKSKGASRGLGKRLLKFAGSAKGLPPDMAKNHDHYIHGASKK